MPLKCFVPMCKSNYDANKANDSGYINVYKFPKDQKQRDKWLHNIKRTDDVPVTENSVVCKLHFRESDFSTESVNSYKGRITPRIRILKKPKLRKGAIPCIFPNYNYATCQDNESRNTSNKRRIVLNDAVVPDEKKSKVETVNLDSNFEKLIPFDSSDCTSFWSVIKHGVCIIFALISVDGCARIMRDLTLCWNKESENFAASVHVETTLVEVKFYKHFLDENNAITCESQIANILAFGYISSQCLMFILLYVIES